MNGVANVRKNGRANPSTAARMIVWVVRLTNVRTNMAASIPWITAVWYRDYTLVSVRYLTLRK
jgi:hypothetical protein